MKPYFITCKEAMEARLLLQVRPGGGQGGGPGYVGTAVISACPCSCRTDSTL